MNELTTKRFSGRTKALILLFLISVLARTTSVTYRLHEDPNKALKPDSPSYIRPALALLHDHRFSINQGRQEPEFFRTPGYPFLLAVGFTVLGEDFVAICITQAILSAGTVVLIFLLAEKLWSRKIAWIAAVLVLLEPLQALYTGTILTETVATFLLILVALFAVSALQLNRTRPSVYFAIGTALALSILVRPGNYYLSMLLLVLFLWNFRRSSEEWKVAVLSIVLFLIPLLLIVGGWKLRNHLFVDSWRLSGVDSWSLYMTRAAGMIARVEGIPINQARIRLQEKLGRQKRTESIGNYYERMRIEGLKIIRQHPGEFIPMTLDGARDFFGGSRYMLDAFNIQRNSVSLALCQYLLLVFYVFVLAGFAISFRSGHRMSHVLLLLICLYIALISVTSPLSIARYRVPITPIFCAYAAATVCYLYDKRRKKT